MSTWLYRIVPARPAMVATPTDAETATIAAHFRYLVELRERGILILAGRTQVDEGTFGIVIYTADDADAARAVADADPGVAGGVFSVEVYPYAVAVARDGLE